MGILPWPRASADAADVWDHVTLGGDTLPGLATVKVTLKNEWDRKKGTGATGETQTFHGTKAPDIQIKLRLTSAKEWDAFCVVAPRIHPAPGKKSQGALDIVHPATSLWGVSAMIVESITGPEQSGHELVINITGFAFLPKAAKNVTSTAGGKPKGGADYYEVGHDIQRAGLKSVTTNPDGTTTSTPLLPGNGTPQKAKKLVT